jgi:hypothetical protein
VNAQGRSITVRQLLEGERPKALHLEVVAGEAGLGRQSITNPRLQKPGLALAGYLPYVKPGRVQILGESEYSYLATMEPAEAASRLISLVDLQVPCIVSAKGLRPSDEVLHRCDEQGVPLLASPARTSDLIGGLSSFLEDELAPRIQLHGVLVNVFSLGTLILGDAGIGKSECALELVYRGHRLVADDLVVIRRTTPGLLVAHAAGELPGAARRGHHRRPQALRHDSDLSSGVGVARNPAGQAGLRGDPEGAGMATDVDGEASRLDLDRGDTRGGGAEVHHGRRARTRRGDHGRDRSAQVPAGPAGIQDEREFLEAINETAARRAEAADEAADE